MSKEKKPLEKENILEIESEEKNTDVELVPGEEEEDDPEDDAILDDDEVDPFKDKWEE